MAVYTHVPPETLERFIARYDLGGLKNFAGITEGIENTNYRVEAGAGRFILTLFEKRVAEADLPFFLEFMAHLVAKGTPAPTPIPDRSGTILQSLCGRPAVIVSFLDGAGVDAPGAMECRIAGEVCARLHAAAADFARYRRNALDLSGWRDLAATCAPRADACAPGLAALIAEEIAHLSGAWPRDLPKGVIHADLFPDNVFLKDGAFSGVIDFYFSCTDFYAYDLAIALCAWAGEGGWKVDHARSLMDGYRDQRKLSDDEQRALPTLLRGAALRFLLTRLYDWLNQVDGAQVRVKDPLAYRDLLLTLRDANTATLGLDP